MPKTLRIVVDTNVLISGFYAIKDSPSFQIIFAIRQQKLILVTSPQILNEVEEVINRERIIKLLKTTSVLRKKIISQITSMSDITDGKQLFEIVGRDRKDDKFLACAVEAQADYIITGDKDLLVIKEFKGTQIITPRKFLDILNKIA